MKSYRYLLLCGLVLFCCGGSAGAKEFRIGVLYWSMNIPGQVAMRLGLEEEAVRINTTAAMSGDASVTLIAKSRNHIVSRPLRKWSARPWERRFEN